MSLDNESSMNKIFEPNLWPVGIVVRPSRPRRQDSQGNHMVVIGNREPPEIPDPKMMSLMVLELEVMKISG